MPVRLNPAAFTSLGLTLAFELTGDGSRNSTIRSRALPGNVNQIHCNFWSYLESVFERFFRNDSNCQLDPAKRETQIINSVIAKDRCISRSIRDCGLQRWKRFVEI
jgi:hypothetical protein